jgi:uncharacterized protein involved in exopolysaccharide biosynthesis
LPTLNVLDLFERLRRRALPILLWGLAMAVAGYAISFLVTPVYRASAVILPPEDDELTAALSFSRSSVMGMNPFTRLGSYFTQADIAMAILRSRTLREGLVHEFDLQHRYHAKTEERAIRILDKKTHVGSGTDGTISVSVEDRDPKTAAAMANRYISELDAFNRDFRSFRARRTRMFLSARVAQADSSLRAIERSLVLYQKQKGAVVLPPDVRGSVDAAASLMGDKAAAEVELELMRGYASPQSDEVQRLEARVNELGRQIGALPATQAGGADLLRQVTVEQEVYGFLTAQLEQARIREAMDTPAVQLLDSARPPEKRVWPRRSWIALFGLLAGALVGFVEPWRWSARTHTTS